LFWSIFGDLGREDHLGVFDIESGITGVHLLLIISILDIKPHTEYNHPYMRWDVGEVGEGGHTTPRLRMIS